jgi:arylsulfatase
VLPIPERGHVGLTTYDAKDPDTSFPPITPVRPPEGAPNALVIMIDDAGFGSSSTFGGPCDTPNLDRLAANGLRYNRFHTTSLCSPTRAALLAGRNHHTVGMGGITEIATSAPGYSSVRPQSCAPLAETLKLNGYSTAQFGKCHEVPVWQTSPMGPFDHWPSGSGFEKFYGFVGAETNQWYPALYDGNVAVEPSKTPTLYIDGEAVGDGKINATVPMIYSGDETCDVGCDTGTAVSEDYTSATSEFTGNVNWVELHAGNDTHDHLISADELMRVATTFQ